jgi:hypothetical protein
MKEEGSQSSHLYKEGGRLHQKYLRICAAMFEIKQFEINYILSKLQF